MRIINVLGYSILLSSSLLSAATVTLALPPAFTNGITCILPASTPSLSEPGITLLATPTTTIAGIELQRVLQALVYTADTDPVYAMNGILFALNYALVGLNPTTAPGTATDLATARDALLQASARWAISTYITPALLNQFPQTALLPAATPALNAPGIMLNTQQTTTVAGQNLVAVMQALIALATTDPLSAQAGMINVLCCSAPIFCPGETNFWQLDAIAPLVNAIVSQLSSTTRQNLNTLLPQPTAGMIGNTINLLFENPAFMSSLPTTVNLPANTPALSAPGITLNGAITTTIAGANLAAVCQALIALKNSPDADMFKVKDGFCTTLNYALVAFDPTASPGTETDLSSLNDATLRAAKVFSITALVTPALIAKISPTLALPATTPDLSSEIILNNNSVTTIASQNVRAVLQAQLAYVKNDPLFGEIGIISTLNYTLAALNPTAGPGTASTLADAVTALQAALTSN